LDQLVGINLDQDQLVGIVMAVAFCQVEVAKLDVATRKAMTHVGMYHPTADIDQLYVWRSEGDRGLLNLVNV